MKFTLREHIKQILSDLEERQRFLRNSIEEYKQSNQLQDAANCRIRLDTLETVRVRLVDALAEGVPA